MSKASRNDTARRAWRGERPTAPQQKSGAGQEHGDVGRAMVEGGVARIWAEAVIMVRMDRETSGKSLD